MRVVKNHIKLGKLCLAVLALILIGGQAWGATLYVSKIGGEIKYRSAAWPDADNGTVPSPNDLQAVVDASSGNDVIILSGGAVGGAGVSYLGAELDSDSAMVLNKALNFRGCKSTDLGYAEHGGLVTLDGNGAAATLLSLNIAASTIENFKVGNVSSAAQYHSVLVNIAGCTIQDIFSFNALGANSGGIAFNKATTILNVKVENCNQGFRTDGGYESSAYNCRIYNCAIGLYAKDASTVLNFNNGSVIGCNAAASAITAATTIINLKNSIVIATSGLATLPLYENGGVITANNCILLPHATVPKTYYDFSTIEGYDTCIYDLPGLTSYRFGDSEHGLKCAYHLDDVNSIDDTVAAVGVAQVGQVLGVAVTATTATSISADQKASLVTLINAGHEVLWHGRTHNSLDSVLAFKLKTVAVGETANFIVTGTTMAEQVQIDSSDNDNDCTISITSDMTMTALATAVNTAVGAGVYTFTQDNPGRMARTLANGTTAISNVDAQISSDETRMLSDEVGYAITLLNAAVNGAAGDGTAAKTWAVEVGAYPNNDRTAASDAALLAAGLSACRADTAISRGSTSLNIMALPQIGIDYFAANDAVSQENFDRSAKAFASLSLVTGLPIVFWAHGTEIDAALTTTYHTKALLALKNAGFNVVSLKTLSDDYKSRWTDSSDHLAYTRSDTDSGDMRLVAGSPAIGSGVLITGLHDQASAAKDYAGTDVTWGPSIGAYQPTGAAPIWANLNGDKLLRASQAVTITGDHSAETIDLSNAVNTGVLTITGQFKLGKIISNAAVSFVGTPGSRITGAIELGDNVKMSAIPIVHE